MLDNWYYFWKKTCSLPKTNKPFLTGMSQIICMSTPKLPVSYDIQERKEYHNNAQQRLHHLEKAVKMHIAKSLAPLPDRKFSYRGQKQ